MNKILGFAQRARRSKPTKVYLQRMHWSDIFPDRKSMHYVVATDHGEFELAVEVPYHPDDREADRLGRLEVRRLLNSAISAT
jgi:hypothetical protein